MPGRRYTAPVTYAQTDFVLIGAAAARIRNSAGTEFQQRVWSALKEIPSGETRSYGEVAASIRSPKATRAVGSACGANPIPVLIPCHRVLASGGRLGGFSGGLDWKRRLLMVEGVFGETADQTPSLTDH